MTEHDELFQHINTPLDSDVALTLDHLLERLHAKVVFTAGTVGRFGQTTTYEFTDYFNACIFAEIMRGRGNFHGEPWLWPTGAIRLVVSLGYDEAEAEPVDCDELFGPVNIAELRQS